MQMWKAAAIFVLGYVVSSSGILFTVAHSIADLAAIQKKVH